MVTYNVYRPSAGISGTLTLQSTYPIPMNLVAVLSFVSAGGGSITFSPTSTTMPANGIWNINYSVSGGVLANKPSGIYYMSINVVDSNTSNLLLGIDIPNPNFNLIW